MTVQALSLIPNNTTDAQFRAWGKGISDAIAAVGLVKTADTGQIDWTTVVHPPTPDLTQGYEIWRFNDTLQATAPVFIKLGYGSSHNANNPQIMWSVGTGSNGSGTLTGTGSGVSPRIWNSNLSTSQWGSTFAAPIWVNSDGSALMIGGWFNYNAQNFAGGLLLIERMRNWDGTPNGEGLLTFTQQATGSANAACIRQNFIYANASLYTQPTQINSGGCFMVNESITPANTAIVGSKVYAYPFFTGWTPQMHGPSKYVVGIYGGDAPVNTQFAVNHYGVSTAFSSIGTFGGVWSSAFNTLSGAFRITS